MHLAACAVRTNGDFTKPLIVDDLVVLVEHVIERLVYETQILQDNSNPSLHAQYNLVNEYISSIFVVMLAETDDGTEK